MMTGVSCTVSSLVSDGRRRCPALYDIQVHNRPGCLQQHEQNSWENVRITHISYPVVSQSEQMSRAREKVDRQQKLGNK
jgi:hypothetical protein